MDYSKLLPYVPEKGILFIEKWLSPYWFYLTIKNPRETKLGDYRLPLRGQPHKITVNAGMSKSLCFLTLTHEIAHLAAYDLHSREILPHGQEWKKIFSDMILKSLDVYEEDLRKLLLKYARNPKANFYADRSLSEYFLRKENDNVIFVKDLEYKQPFLFKGKIYYRLEKQKTRYLCLENKTNKRYLITGSAPVQAVKDDKE
ncbi:MAG: SprT-like domain-containing protein [Flavobacteriaceae bacterium]|jgi:hypothetical protein|nr:SprT-like domain-containing protein [Flavobacteriaceae bacterium]